MKKAPIFPVLTLLLALGIMALYYLSVRTVPQKETADGTKRNDVVMPLSQPTVTFGNPMIGRNEATVTIVEFGDYLCEPCSALDATLRQLAEEYPDDVRLIWKDLPNEGSHPGATAAALAARCAGYQDAFFDYHRQLLGNADGQDQDGFLRLAAGLGLNEEQFRSCLQNSQSKPLVQRDVEEALRLQVDATPYLFVNGRRLSGSVSDSLLRNIIEGEISQAARTAAETPVTD